MKIEIFSIGTELLLGHTVDTNSAWLSQELAKMGVDVFYHSSVGDNSNRIKEALSLAASRSDGVIVTGGLGPTEDDVTPAAIAEFAGKKLIHHPAILKKIQAVFRHRRIKMAKLNERQAYLPDGAREIPNPVGTAPGFILQLHRPTFHIQHSAFNIQHSPSTQHLAPSTFPIIALPGVPREMKPMFEKTVRPYLSKKIPKKEILISRTLRTTGLPESTAAQRIGRWLRLKPPLTVGIYARLGEVDVRIMAKGSNLKKVKRAIEKVEKEISRKLKKILFGFDNQTLEEVVVHRLIAERKTLAIAESCTGGLAAHRITNVSGSSKTLQLGLVLYSNREKTKILGVPETTLKKYGAVSRAVATLMARRVREQAGTHYGIGITGIAGPTGGTRKKPVGLIFIALATPTGVNCRELRFRGNRQEIKWQASQAALNMLRLRPTL